MSSTDVLEPLMKWCSVCGAAVDFRVPDGDNLRRHVCPNCGTVHYINPRIVAGCIATYQGKILLAKRAIEPRYGYWTLPAGFMEYGESVDEGAARETREEACADVDITRLHAIVSVPHIGQVHMFYLAQMRDAQHKPGVESLETALVDAQDIPWDDLAFPTVRTALKTYLDDLKTGRTAPHNESITWPPPPSDTSKD